MNKKLAAAAIAALTAAGAYATPASADSSPDAWRYVTCSPGYRARSAITLNGTADVYAAGSYIRRQNGGTATYNGVGSTSKTTTTLFWVGYETATYATFSGSCTRLPPA